MTALTQRTVTTSGRVLDTDELVICNSASDIILNLPQASGNGRQIYIKNIGAGGVYVTAPGSINGAGSKSMAQYESMGIVDYAAGTYATFVFDQSATLDSVLKGTNAVPVSRTNNPIVGANAVNVNIDVLDAAIGANASPLTRSTGPIAVANTVNQNLDALDTVIGADADLHGTVKNISAANSILKNLDNLDIYKSVRTIKVTVGAPGLGGVDYNFTSAEDMVEQVITVTGMIPARARVLDAQVYTDAVFTGAVTMGIEVGTASGGHEIVGTANMYAALAINSMAADHFFTIAPAAAAANVYVSGTPGANWSLVTAGSISVLLTVIDITNV